MDIEQARVTGLADLDEPAVWEDDAELTPGELAALAALDGVPAGAAGLDDAAGARARARARAGWQRRAAIRWRTWSRQCLGRWEIRS